MDLSRVDLPVDVEALDPTVVVVAVVVFVVLILLAILAIGRRRARQREFEDQFGPEYQRTVQDAGSRRRAEEELSRRLERRGSYEVRLLDPGERDRLRSRWDDVQASFVDGPESAARAAVQLVEEAAVARGYPEGADRCLDDISVDHPELVADVRRARNAKGSSIERHRETLLRARTLFERLVSDGEAGEAEVVTPPPFAEEPERGMAGPEPANRARSRSEEATSPVAASLPAPRRTSTRTTEESD